MSTRTKPEMNVRLLRRVQKAILKHPDQFQMEHFYAEYLDDLFGCDVGGCGTAACIAGWVQHLTFKKRTLVETCKMRRSTWAVGQRELKLTNEQAVLLFLGSRWPEHFREQFSGETSPMKRACIAAKRIDHFVETKGEQ